MWIGARLQDAKGRNCLSSSAENKTTNLRAPVAERLGRAPAYTATDGGISMLTSGEYRAKSEEQCIVARRVFEALCVQYPDKYVVLVQPHLLDDPPGDLTVPKTAG